MTHRLHRTQFIPGEPARIWEFFATPRNLAAITPARMRFELVGRTPEAMYAGQMIEYRIGLLPGISTRWLTEITHVREGVYFVDEQRAGPYKLWHHEHHFAPAAGGVTMTDEVTYDVGWSVLGTLLHALWIRPQLETIFAHRARKIGELFPAAMP